MDKSSPNGQEFKQVILLQNLLLRLACNDPGEEKCASYLSQRLPEIQVFVGATSSY